LSLLIVIAVIALFFTFGYMEERKEFVDDVLLEVSGRLDWARSIEEKRQPYGFVSILDRVDALYAETRVAWKSMKWDKAVRLSIKTRKEMDRAQTLFIETQNRARAVV